MVGFASLWLPILLSAVLVFLFSSIVHMVLRIHRNDFAALPGEANVLSALRGQNIPPGDYVFPYCSSPSAMKSPEMQQKLQQGPVGFATIMPSGAMGMGSSLVQWFVYTLVIGVLVAYVTSRTEPAGAAYASVFRVAGTVAFIAYAGAVPVTSIWGKRKWSTTWKHVFDGLLYSLLVGGAFAGFWPKAM